MGRARSSEKSTGAKASPLLRDRVAAIRACERSGETLNAYAARTGVSVSTLYEAKRRARSLDSCRRIGVPAARRRRSSQARRVAPRASSRRPSGRLRETKPSPGDCAFRAGRSSKR